MKNLIDLEQRYALLDTGDIEPLHFENGEPRETYVNESGEVYLYHDVFVEEQKATVQQRRCDRIVATDNLYWVLWEMKNERHY